MDANHLRPKHPKMSQLPESAVQEVLHTGLPTNPRNTTTPPLGFTGRVLASSGMLRKFTFDVNDVLQSLRMAGHGLCKFLLHLVNQTCDFRDRAIDLSNFPDNRMRLSSQTRVPFYRTERFDETRQTQCLTQDAHLVHDFADLFAHLPELWRPLNRNRLNRFNGLKQALGIGFPRRVDEAAFHQDSRDLHSSPLANVKARQACSKALPRQIANTVVHGHEAEQVAIVD